MVAIWQQDEFDQFEKSLAPSRLAHDAEKLKYIFNYCAHRDRLKDSLKWAKDHGIQFFIDHKLVDAGGYYTEGTGVVAVSLANANKPLYACGVIAHEIRHAWQDYHGLLPYAGCSPFADYYARVALIEADARAHQIVSHIEPHSLRTRDTMWVMFQDWFDKKAEWYGVRTASDYAQDVLKRPDLALKTAIDAEFRPVQQMPFQAGIDLGALDSIYQLGQTYNDMNYLVEGAGSRDFLRNTVLPLDNVLSFYGKANDEQKALVQEIHRIDTQTPKAPFIRRP